jgi:hypothetical protein
MKSTICAIAALSISLTHSLLEKNINRDQPSDAAETIQLNNHEAASGFHMVANTESNAAYQSWYSSDQTHWHRGHQFTGNGKIRVITFKQEQANLSDQLFVKIEQL